MDILAVSNRNVGFPVVIHMCLILAVRTRELLADAVVLVGRPTVQTRLSCVRRVHEVHESRRQFNLVFNQFHESRVGPLLEIRPVRDVFVDVVNSKRMPSTSVLLASSMASFGYAPSPETTC
jgi:hypothetical protein